MAHFITQRILCFSVIEGLEDDPDADDYYDPVRDMIGHYNDSLEILAELKSETKVSTLRLLVYAIYC